MKFTEAEDDFIKANYLLIPAKRISKILGRSEGTARQRMKLIGCVPPPEVTERFKQESYIKKGSVSFNKGKKQSDYRSPDSVEKTVQTRFKIGSIPHNAKERNGVITIRTDKRGVRYKFIRVSLGKWMPLARYNWERVNGSIARNLKLVHRDGDQMNCEVENLELLTPGELMKRNSYHNLPPEITQTIHLSAVLTRKINQKQKLYEKQN
jgi:hypothetical protein